ncbi:YtxH domain-containing protein [Bacillus sp. 2205SS5-2]|uniref:YtxH domain-containing protein n=1 Tax=Bacillus sp. 2205SS5-2 TaxID=3109031 RepID=UPI003007A691
MAKNRLVQGMVYGAIIGGAISMLDRNTREGVVDGTKKSGKQIKHYSKNPKQMSDYMKDLYDKFKTTADQLNEDVKFVNEKFETLRNEVTPQVKEVLEETKNNLQESQESYKEVFQDEEKSLNNTNEMENTDYTTSDRVNRNIPSESGNNIRTYQNN